MSTLETHDVHAQLEQFWKVEDVAETVKYTKQERYCEEHFIRTHTQDETGRFTVTMPLKNNYKSIGDTFELANRRFLSLERRLQKDANLSHQYQNFIHEYMQLGHMTKLQPAEIHSNDLIYYLPHHCIVKNSRTTTKLRVVFDGSAKEANNLSLNDVAYVGPNIQDDLVSILIRFRKHSYAIKADITKMYRQVRITPDQQNLQRILWRDSSEQEISHYKLNTVTYGTAPASFLAIRTLHQAAINKQESFPNAVSTILSDFYVDDLITGCNTIEEARTLKNDIFEILKSAGFILTQWMSNDNRILNSYEQEHTEDYHITDNQTIKTLGILWNPNFDTFQYTVNINLSTNKITKRVILATISQIFDPLGLIGPVVIKAKIILQELWKLQLDWDESMPQDQHSSFLRFFNELTNLDQIRIPRHVFLSNHIVTQMHGFTDASESAYGVCLYVRTTDSNNRHHSQLLCAKSRVAPIKVISLPRLELCGALLLAQLLNKCTKAMQIPINNTYLWTDSKIVLAWLAQEPTRWNTFVSNRVSEIQGRTENCYWKHVCSSENPADIISRGCNPKQLLESTIWWSGPDWLQQDIGHWPIDENTIDETSNFSSIPEQRKKSIQSLSLHTTTQDQEIFNRFSSLNRLEHVTAYILRFCRNARTSKNERSIGNLTIQEIDGARTILIKLLQAQTFPLDLHKLKKSLPVPKTSRLACLNPFLDDLGIIRVGGRLRNSQLEYDHKYPIVLPCKHPFTNLVISHEHIRTFHGGVQTVLSAIRAKYWPLNGKDAVRRLIRKCILCFKIKPSGISPLMGQLPAARIKSSRPFITCGIDFAGPFLVKDGTLRNRKLVKTYICLFICFASKAIHIELVGDLSTESFMNALKRFFSRRGISKNIHTDNGTNFVGASNKINNIHETLLKLHKDETMQEYLRQNQIVWHFIPPRAPHFGGLWESAIKSMKYHLTRKLQNLHLTYEGFYTIITQVEAILNSRPISPLSIDPNDPYPLTPGHFLIGTPLDALPEENIEHIQTNRLTKYKQMQQLTQQLWRRWSSEYLHTLQQRNKWMFADPKIILPGLMVLIKEDNLPPLNWKVGRIMDTSPGKDNIARVASVKTSGGVIKRAFSKLCILPVQ